MTTASEKLRTLMQTPEADTVNGLLALVTALPQIVAVVEAAEAARPPMGPSVYDPLRAALSALEEALS